ncbi:imelysin family protein [Variovorax sp. LT1R16]|uniref:imelysin family protein n=1 Tax=Variovorax sp. LT1R16 TaxID=3443728 RepID=UPI003F44DD96
MSQTNRFSLLPAALMLLLAGAAQAQPAAVAPAGAPQFLASAYRDGFVPRATAFATESAALNKAVDTLCEGSDTDAAAALEAARTQWRATTSAWDRLAGVAVGPLVKRRALTALDFNPTRPPLIERAIGSAPVGAEAMERVGTPAKGIPALEWLLWTKKPAPQSPACRYTQQVAIELAREGATLSAGFAELAATDWAADPARTYLAWQELFNQWLGGFERLRWAQIDKPLKTVETSNTGKAPVFARAVSGHAAQSWAAQWEALRSLAAPVAQTLAASGKQALAERLTQAVAEADAAMQRATPADLPALPAATRALAGVKKLIEADVAPALKVVVGFSDGDGD